MALRAVGQDPVGRGRDRHDGRAPTAGSRWRSRGPACARSACPRSRCRPFPRSSARGWRPGPTSSGTPAPTRRSTGSAAWPAMTCTRSRSCSRATDEQCRRSIEEHDKLLARTDGVRSLSFLDLNATPPFNYAHDHFGFRDRLSQPVMKGSGEEPTPGSGAALEPGEFILGYPDENGPVANLPEPEVLSRNGSYMAYRRLQEHVGAFRDYLHRERGNAGRAGAARREVHGPLAQRCAAGAGTGQGRSRAGCGSDAQQRLQLQGDGPARVCRVRSAPMPAG